MKHSQLSVFFILGIVIIALIGFFYYMVSSQAEIQLKGKANRMASDFISKSSIKFYVQTCLDQSLKEGLELVGMQGGYIYDKGVEDDAGRPKYMSPVQIYGTATKYLGPVADLYPGTYDNYFDYGDWVIPYIKDGNMYNLTYAIMRSRQSSSDEILDFPDYPDPDTPLRFDYSFFHFDDAFKRRSVFGNCLDPDCDYRSDQRLSPGFPRLCSQGGSNSYDVDDYRYSCGDDRTGSVIFDETNPNYAWDLVSRSNVNTIQNYLEHYIWNRTVECVDIEKIQKQGMDVSVSVDHVIVNLTFGEYDVDTRLHYPLNITFEGMPPVTRFLYFNSKQKVRFKLIYELASWLIENEVNNPFFYVNTWGNGIMECPKFFDDSTNPLYMGKRHYVPGDSDFTSVCKKPGMEIKYLDNTCGDLIPADCDTSDKGKYAKYVLITDTESELDGKPYEFYFAVENRYPVLDYIDAGSDEFSDTSKTPYYKYLQGPSLVNNKFENEPYGSSYTETAINLYCPSGGCTANLVNIEKDIGEKIHIVPLGVDPDDSDTENLHYHYEGWGTGEQIKDVNGNALTAATLGYEDTYWNPAKSGIDHTVTSWGPSTIAGAKTKDKENDNSLPGPVDSSQVGFHWVRIWVCDDEGEDTFATDRSKCDYQDVKIHIKCINSDIGVADGDCCSGPNGHWKNGGSCDDNDDGTPDGSCNKDNGSCT